MCGVLQEQLPPDGPELEAQREVRKQYDTEWSNCVIAMSALLEPVNLDLYVKTEEGEISTPDVDELLKQTVYNIESESSSAQCKAFSTRASTASIRVAAVIYW